MKNTINKINAFSKGLILWSRPHVFLGWLRHPLQTTSNTLNLAKWMAAQDKGVVLNDFYTARRDYPKRYQLYQSVATQLKLEAEPIDYLEFGVAAGHSIKWWVAHLAHTDSRFYGFDTFEGLPEKWGTFDKGAMAENMPQIPDARVAFFKGLFQDTLPSFLKNSQLDNGKRKVIHLDADLFSSTLFALASLAPYLKKGDVLLFDEFNVPNHEFLAFKMFSDSFYVKTRLLGAVNNFYQVALIIE